MPKLAAPILLALLLAACSAPPELIEDGEGGTGGGTDSPDAGDGSGGGTDSPDVGDSQSLRALYGGEVNAIQYDPDSRELVINNLPLDGQIYRETGPGLDGFQTFKNSEEALRTYFAVRRETGTVEVAAVGTGNYAETGYGGYMVRRASDTVDLPATGEAVYEGKYAGVRVVSGNQQGARNIAYTQGDATLEVDFGDFDVVGAVEGRIENRRVLEADGSESEQPDIVLGTGEIEGSGRFSGEVRELVPGEEAAGAGSYVGLFAGPGGSEAGGAILLEKEAMLERGVFTVEK